MKVLLLLAAVIMAFVPIQIHGSPMNFGEMVLNTTGRPFWPFFNSYGCYCDYEGKGTPKDAIDRCCFVHNCCYSDLEKRGCDIKVLNYEFTSETGIIICSANQDSCKKELCQCDKVAAECFAQNLKSYSKKYHRYPNVGCNGKTPEC
ncbi:phospholipase A2, membrane associated-like [Acomys russatus]|uniref:phospholipase A2, membrane associated-like n=1 Tax=Acomys russatus TaxID=60746 RepID=UPI0021E26F05|nr:phospholipase A2, membrane associated-like [Acomys russatus]